MFIKKLNAYITNINGVLKNIKSKILIDFVCSDQADITIITNKVTFSLNLQTIKKYVKNISSIVTDKVKVL